MQILRTASCCGVREIQGLEGAGGAEVVRLIHHGIRHSNLDGAFWWWGDNAGSGNGRRLAKYFEKYELGEIVKTPQVHNPQSDHELEMWVLVLDHDALYKWIERYGE